MDILDFIKQYAKMPKEIIPKLTSDYITYNLKSLDLSSTLIQELPESFDKLTSLQTLDLSSTNIQELPESFSKLTNLQVLNLKLTEIQKFLELFDTLTNLQTLDLSFTKIKYLQELPESFSKLTNLQVLNLSSTSIQELPESFSKLTNLQVLNLSSTSIQELPKSFSKLTNLRTLDLSSTAIRDLPELFSELTNLQTLDLSSTKIQSLPESFDNLINLQVLNLSSTAIRDLPESLSKLINLRTLDLSNLVLDKIPYSLNKIFEEYTFTYTEKKLSKTIKLESTKLLKQPISIFYQNKNLIDAYYEEEKTCINEAKVIFLGDSGVGKTFIIDRILNKGKMFIEEHKTTDTSGILIKNYKFEKIKIDFWDFGSKEIMHSMYRCFLTSRTMYVVVVDGSTGMQNERVFYWLYNIKSFAPDCPVLVIINKIDKNKNAFLNGTNLKESYPMFCGCQRISALKSNEKEFNLIIQKLADEVKKLNSFGIEFPKSWLSLKNKLSSLKENYITGTKYNKLCIKYGIDEDVGKWLLEWFNDLGICFSYHMDRSKIVLKDYKILNPQWITNAISNIICNGSYKSSNGILLLERLEEFINNCDNITDNKYTRMEIVCILEIIEKFEIAYRVDDNHKFIPTLCDISKPDDINYNNNDLIFTMKYKYLPDNVIHKLMVKQYKNLDSRYIWYSGMCLKNIFDDEYLSLAIVEKLEMDNTITIRITNSNESVSHKHLNFLKKILLDINTELNLKTDDYFVYNNIEISHKTIKNHINYNRKTIYLDNINKHINISYFGEYVVNKDNSQELKTPIHCINQNNYVNYIKNDVKENKGQLNQSFDKSTLNPVQNYNTFN